MQMEMERMGREIEIERERERERDSEREEKWKKRIKMQQIVRRKTGKKANDDEMKSGGGANEFAARWAIELLMVTEN